MIEQRPNLSSILFHAMRGIDNVNANLEFAEQQNDDKMVTFLREVADHYHQIVRSAERILQDSLQSTR